MTHPIDTLIIAVIHRAEMDSRSTRFKLASAAVNWLLSDGLEWLGVLCPGTDTEAAGEAIITRTKHMRIVYRQPREEWRRPKGEE